MTTPTAAADPGPRSKAGATALTGRLRVLSATRIAIGLAALLLVVPAASDTAPLRDTLLVATAAYLVANVLTLVLLRARAGLGRILRDVTLLLDAAWGTTLLAATGGPLTPFTFVVYLQVVAATVLFAWQTGVKLALGYTIGIGAIVFSGVEIVRGGVTLDLLGVPVSLAPFLDPSAADGDRLTAGIVAAVTLWVMAGTTAYLSSVNERDLRRSNRELAVLRELNTELERSLDLDDVAEAIARGTVRELGYARSVVWMSRDGVLVPAGADGFDPDALGVLGSLRLTVGPGPVGRAVEMREPQLVAREHARPAALADAFDIDSPLVVVPLITEGRLLGLLTVEVATPLGRSPRLRGRDVRILATLATEASLALDNARLHAELRDLSVTDALTGVYNHRYFQQRLQEELDRSVRRSDDAHTVPVSLILMDIDYFKRVNDRFGHPSGDELLRSFAKLTARVLRSSDVVCRYGGEEFAIILPETDASEALRVAERLREAVERSNFMGADGRYLGRVTASFGVESYDTGLPSRSEMIQRSDEAMYAAKERGRNQVVHADELDTASTPVPV